MVVRSQRGAVALDLDGDGNEGTGWVLLYMHMTPEGRAGVGTWLNTDDPLGHPSCEGGVSTGHTCILPANIMVSGFPRMVRSR